MRLKFNSVLSIFIFVFIVTELTSQSAKVVAYFPSYRFQYLEQIDFCKITHLNLAFANPNAEGYLLMDDVSEVVEHARIDNPDIKILIALAGGALSSEQATNWSNLIDVVENRPAFILKILEYVESNNLDGVDMDLEWNHVTDGYDEFVIELGETLKINSLIFTAALPATYRYPEVTDAVIDMYDWINLMAYDLTGSWDPDNEGPHSPYFFARAGIDYWKGFGVGGEKLTLGVPFYGVEFGNGGVSAFTYRSMVEMDTAYAYLDEVGSAYYNGITTIKEKVILASEEVSGTMIWEVGQDHFSQFSLLRAIDEQYNALAITTTASNCGIVKTDNQSTDVKISIFPNPVNGPITIVSPLEDIESIGLWDMHGRHIKIRNNLQQRHVELQLNNLPPAFYFLKVYTANGVFVKQLLKQ